MTLENIFVTSGEKTLQTRLKEHKPDGFDYMKMRIVF